MPNITPRQALLVLNERGTVEEMTPVITALGYGDLLEEGAMAQAFAMRQASAAFKAQYPRLAATMPLAHEREHADAFLKRNNDWLTSVEAQYPDGFGVEARQSQRA